MKSSSKNILIAGAGGMAAGAILGLLFAPAEGKQTRKAIASKTKDVADSITSIDPSELLNGLKATVESKFSQGKSEAKDELLEQIHNLEELIKKA